jgi:NAD(P)H-dependent FMN reductase
MKIRVIIGSTRQGRVGPQVAEYVAAEVKKIESDVKILDLVDYPMPFFDAPMPPAALAGNYEHDAVRRWSQAVAEADAFIFISPEYNHGISAVLKNAIDWLWSEWAGKPAAIVSYSGGSVGGARGAEQLKLAVNEVGVLIVQHHVAMGGVRGEVPAVERERAAKQLAQIVSELQTLVSPATVENE